MVEHDFGLWLIDLCVDVGELEHVRLHRFGLELLGKFEDSFGISRRSNNETHRKIIRTRKSCRHYREHSNSRNSSELLLDERQIIFCRRLAHAPRFQNHSAKTVVWECQLKGEPCVRNSGKNFAGGIGITNCVVDRCIGRRSHDAEDHALIFLRS